MYINIKLPDAPFSVALCMRVTYVCNTYVSYVCMHICMYVLYGHGWFS